MNPSAAGWILKFGSLQKGDALPYKDLQALHRDLRSCGFMYGINVAHPGHISTAHRLSQDENAKLNLLSGLYYCYRLKYPDASFDAFLKAVRDFYRELDLAHPNLLQKVFRRGKPAAQLEKLLDSRVYLGEPILSRTFNSIITNVLLPIDLLAFQAFLEGEKDPRAYASDLESVVIHLIYHSLDTEHPQESRRKLREVFESSRTYLRARHESRTGDVPGLLGSHRGTLASRYFLDIAALTVLEGNSLDSRQQRYVFRQGKALGFKKMEVTQALRDVQAFFKMHSKSIYFLREALPGAQYYDSMTRVVDKLIIRNSKRLRQELMQSRELMLLLSKSTLKELSPEEKKKVQKQLLDIFKSIPSLAIFLLPGGAVLLPIFISLIPKLLPSSFDENRVE